MAFIPVPDTAAFTMRYLGPDAQVVVNTYYFRKVGVAWDPASLDAVAQILIDWESTLASVWRSSSISLVAVEARDINTADSFVIVVDVDPPIPGQEISPILPMNVTWAVTLRTPFAGRSFRGRTYWVGLAESMAVGDFLTAPTQAGIQSALDQIRGLVAIGTGDTQVVVSRFFNGAPRVTGVATPITSVSPFDGRVDTQRRRLVGSGA